MSLLPHLIGPTNVTSDLNTTTNRYSMMQAEILDTFSIYASGNGTDGQHMVEWQRRTIGCHNPHSFKYGHSIYCCERCLPVTAEDLVERDEAALSTRMRAIRGGIVA